MGCDGSRPQTVPDARTRDGEVMLLIFELLFSLLYDILCVCVLYFFYCVGFYRMFSVLLPVSVIKDNNYSSCYYYDCFTFVGASELRCMV